MDNLKIAKDKLDYLNEWKRSFKVASDIVPYIDLMYGFTVWEYDVFNSAPSTELFQHENYNLESLAELKSKIPLLPKIDFHVAVSATPSSTGSYTYDSLLNAKSYADQNISSWAQVKTEEYEKIQELQNSKSKVRERLKLLDEKLVDEFDLAERYYSSYVMNIEGQEAVGTSMRNVLEKYKGKLYAKAKRLPEQKIKWDIFAERLSVDTVGSLCHRNLLNQKIIWDDLHSDLSSILKLNKVITLDEIKVVHTKYINHLLSVLLSVRL